MLMSATYIELTICENFSDSSEWSVPTLVKLQIHQELIFLSLFPQGPSGPQGAIGYPGPRGVKVWLISLSTIWLEMLVSEYLNTFF